jgi:hypothetical protein
VDIMSFLATYAIVHVVISLVGIGSGLIVLAGLLTGKRLNAQSEPPFGVAQLVVLVLFIALGTLAVRRSKTI